jgi:hypothetical protein
LNILVEGCAIKICGINSSECIKFSCRIEPKDEEYCNDCDWGILFLSYDMYNMIITKKIYFGGFNVDENIIFDENLLWSIDSICEILIVEVWFY